MRNQIFEEVQKCIEEIREAEKTLSQEEIEKEREKVVDTVVRAVELLEISREEGLLALEEWMNRKGENWEPELLIGIPCIVEAEDREEVQQMLWQRYILSKPKGYDALRYLLNMRGLHDIQNYGNPAFTREYLCSMLPNEIEELYRKRPKPVREVIFNYEEPEEEPEESFETIQSFMELFEREEKALKEVAEKQKEEKKEEKLQEVAKPEKKEIEEVAEVVEEKVEQKDFFDLYTPAKIEEMINEYIIGQPELSKAVADFLYYHKLRTIHPELPIRNLLIAGSSGTGKTEVFRCVQKLFEDIKLKIADGSRVTKDGWTGNYKLKDILNSEIDILVIDEADKLCKPSFASGGHNVSEDMQSEFLKLLEGEYESSGRKNLFSQPNKISIVFVGAFEDIRKKKKKESEIRPIGFGNDYAGETATHEITDEDLIEFGMMPELVGRIANKVTTNDLSNEDYITIMKNPHSRLSSLMDVLKQYDVQVEDIITKEMVVDLINKSKENRTGFRWVSAQVESMVLDTFHEKGLRIKIVRN